MSDQRLDAEIDEVAREMTRGELPADFRARVMARMEDGPARSWIWQRAWILAPLGVAAVVLLAVFVVRAPRQSVGRIAQEVRPFPGDVRREPDRASRTEPSQTPVPVRLEAGTTYDRGVAAVGRRPDATYQGGVASDPAPAPIQIESLDVEAMESMEIAPLSVDGMESIDVPRLDVAPLEMPGIAE
jgi:anti-sigma factor RsiW